MTNAKKEEPQHNHEESCHGHGGKKKFDYVLWGSGGIIAASYLLYWLFPDIVTQNKSAETFSQSSFDLVNTIWWGVAIGIIMISLLSKIPREFVIAILGRGGTFSGIVRATIGGILLDLCSHGILMVGAKLYERGASTGQVMAFLIASPWNSLSLTFILIALVGWQWTLAFVVLSMGIAIISGMIFEILTKGGTLPANPNKIDLPGHFQIIPEAKKSLKNTKFTPSLFTDMLWSGLKESRMVIRWILFGLVMAGLIRTFLPPEQFETLFGPTLMGLGLTLVVATILEVCSEGTVPVAADIMNRAGAPGNGFTFLMAGVATDYTEIMVLRDATKTWKIPLFLPLVTLPQILVLGWVMNAMA